MKILFAFGYMLLVTCCAYVCAQPAVPSLADTAAMYEAAVSVPLLDRRAFITEAHLKSVLLSPDGNHLAYLTDEGHETALGVYELASGAKSRLFSSSRLANIYWTGDSKLILVLDDAVGILDIARPEKPAYIATLDSAREERLLGTSRNELDHALIVARNEDKTYSLEEVDWNGARHELLREDALIASAIMARDGDEVIVDSVDTRGRRFSLLHDGDEEVLFSCALLETCRMLALDKATNTLWLEANRGSDLTSLMAYSLDDRTLVGRNGDQNGIVDLSEAVFVKDQPRIVQYHDGLLRNEGLDAKTTGSLQTVQALLPDSSFTPQISDDGRTWLIRESSAVLQHPRYQLFDTVAETLTEILQDERSTAAAIPATALAEQLPLQYPAQDGSMLYGYVSLPKGKPLASTPMITLVHGGPMGRIFAGYSDFTQFLVNRGYIVFEPNFRASTGYGRKYVEQAAGEFGDGLVQQDIIEGVHYLTAQGIGDPDRLAIAGHSFGGFAVLAGLAFTPELFKAGFASASSADMATIMQFQRTPERMADMDPSVAALADMMFGASDDAAAIQAMHARSPQAQLAAISAPLLLIAGGDDTQVPISHVKEYALALLNQQKTLSLFLDEDEGHGIGQIGLRSKLAYFWMAEQFFSIYLGGSKQALDDPALAKYIRQRMLIDANPDFLVPEFD